MFGITRSPIDFGAGGSTPAVLDIRASVGTSISPTGSAPNVLTYTEQFDNAAWQLFDGASMGSTNVSDPEGGNAADAVLFGASATSQIYQSATFVNGQSYAASVWARVASGTKAVRLKIYGTSDQLSSDITVTTTWTRISATLVAIGSSGGSFGIVNGSAGGAGTVQLYGAQLESGSSVSAYTAHPPRKPVTGVGFQPKVVLPFSSWIDDGVFAQSTLGFGACTTSSQAAIAVSSLNGQPTSVTARRHNNAKAHDIIDPGNQSIRQSAAYSAFGTDGFTFNWPDVLFATVLNHICLGGADLEVSLTMQRMNGTNGAESFAHGLTGGDKVPTALLFFSELNISTPPATLTDGMVLSIGAWAGTNQFTAGCFSTTGVPTTATRRVLSTSAALGYPFTDGVHYRRMNVGSVDGTNVNVSYSNGDNAQHYFFMLAIRGARCQVGTFRSATSNTIATPGITPKLFLPVFVPTGVDNAGAVQADLLITLGASDGTSNVSCGIADENNKTTTNARRYQSSSSLAEYYTFGGKLSESTAAFSGESVVFNPTISDASFLQGGYLVIGR